jgi:rod shape-determining protein MreD
MRWFPFFILAYFFIGLQIGVQAHLSVDRLAGAAPNLVLLAVVFIALNAPRDAALLGAFLLGLIQDIGTRAPLGLFAFSYGIVAMALVRAQLPGDRGNVLWNFFMTLGAGAISGLIIWLHGLISSWLFGLEYAGPTFARMFFVMVYSGFAALIVMPILYKVRRAFGFTPSRHRLG